MNLNTAIEWSMTHGAAAWPVVSALLIVVLRARTPEAWVALAESSPRLHGVVRLLRAIGLDPVKALSALSQIVTGKAPPRAVSIADTIAPVSPSKVEPVDHSGERGSVRLDVIALLLASMLVLAGLGAVLSGCPVPVVPVDGGPAVTPSSWTSTARVVLNTLRWAVPAARSITDVVVPEPARTQVARALDATADAAREMDAAVTAYESAGGDRCVAKAATAGVHRALVGLARVLVENGIALGTTLERVVDGVASVADALTPACDRDAGWASAGDAANRELRAIYDSARVPLRRDLDDLRPAGDAGL